MATYYSILSVHIRPEIQEKISIGFLLVGEGKVFFNFSKNKLSAAKGLLPESSFRLLKDSLKNIETTAVMENNKDAAQLLLNDTLKKNTFSMSYLDYLSRYNNNVLSFSAPKKIDVEPSEEIYNKLFNKFIDDSEIVTTISKTNNADVFKVNNRVQLIKHFNVDREFTSIEIPKLIAPVKVDLLGKNEIPVYVQAVDLDKKIYHIEYELAQLVLLNLAFTEEKKPAKGFVLSREPDRKEVTQHNIWKQLRSSKQFEYIDLSEPEKILDYAKKHGVQPLVANITE